MPSNEPAIRGLVDIVELIFKKGVFSVEKLIETDGRIAVRIDEMELLGADTPPLPLTVWDGIMGRKRVGDRKVKAKIWRASVILNDTVARESGRMELRVLRSGDRISFNCEVEISV